YQQRFDASEKALAAASLSAKEAVQAALAAAKEAVQAASVSAEKSVGAALAAAEKAIDKAEVSQRLHNQMQNEWRGTVNDVTKTVAENARHEAQALVVALTQKMDLSIDGLAQQMKNANTRLDKSEGRATAMAMILPIVAVLAALGGMWISSSRAPAAPAVQLPAIVSPAVPR